MTCCCVDERVVSRCQTLEAAVLKVEARGMRPQPPVELLALRRELLVLRRELRVLRLERREAVGVHPEHNVVGLARVVERLHVLLELGQRVLLRADALEHVSALRPQLRDMLAVVEEALVDHLGLLVQLVHLVAVVEQRRVHELAVV